MATQRKHLLISGLVQGVGYRMHTVRQAQHYQLNGWVRNLPDGRVEVIAEGDETQLNGFINWCSQGPHYAEVTNIDITTSPAHDEFADFEIR